MNHEPVVIIGSILLVAALISNINTKGYAMCNDEVFVSHDEYITGCIVNPGVVSPGEYIYTVRMAPRDGRIRKTGTYFTYLGRTGRETFDILHSWHTPFKSTPEIEDTLNMRIPKEKGGKDQLIKLRSAADCTAASIRVIRFTGDQLEHQIIIPDKCRDKIKR